MRVGAVRMPVRMRVSTPTHTGHHMRTRTGPSTTHARIRTLARTRIVVNTRTRTRTVVNTRTPTGTTRAPAPRS